MSEVSIQLNGEPRKIASDSTIARLLDDLGQHPRTVAVEHNGEILPRSGYATTALKAGDRLEVVRFVQGGSILRFHA